MLQIHDFFQSQNPKNLKNHGFVALDTIAIHFVRSFTSNPDVHGHSVPAVRGEHGHLHDMGSNPLTIQRLDRTFDMD